MTQNADTLAGRSLMQVGLTCRDLERAKGFYRDVLGLPFLFEVSGMLFFQLAGTRLMVGLEHTKGQPMEAPFSISMRRIFMRLARRWKPKA